MTQASSDIENTCQHSGMWLMFGLSVVLFSVVVHAHQSSTKDIPQQPTAAMPTQSPQDNTGTRRIEALRVTEAIKIDGLLNESAWSLAQPASDFLQQQPNEGLPASEKTEVRVLFDDKNLYVGIHVFDSEPKNINARELVRDASFSNDDKVEILLDTYHDRRNAFRFAVNPLGTQLTFRPNAPLLFDFSDSFNNVRLPQGNFTTNFLVGRINYNFSRKLLTSALMQLNSAARVSAVNIRLRYIYRPE